MNFIFLFQRLRWVYLPASLLSVILQRAPLVRLLATAESTLGGGIGALLRSAFTVAAVGGYHALAGATQLSTSPATPASATVGQSFSLAFALTGAPSAARSYEIRGTLPPGLSVPGMAGDLLNASTGTITGTPTTAGSYSLSIRAWSSTNKRGDGGNPTFTVQINVQGGAVAPPTFSTHPASASVNVGANVNFTAAATGGTITYQWRKDGAALSGATAATLGLTNVSVASAGSYDVVATNAGGSTTSNAATLTVSQPAVAPTITTQPLDATATVGGTVSFSAAASGTAPITYQWTKDGAAVAGATAATLTLNAVTLASAGSYQLTATNAAGSAQSAVVTLTVTEPVVAPSITTQPVNATATVGGTVSFSAAASGTAPITYQWTKDGAPIAGATSTTLTLNAVTLTSAGSYRLSATNAAGTAQSNPASLTVTEATVAPSFSTQPTNATATVGGSVTFSAAANGTAPITYQWTKDGAPIAGATSTTLTLNAVTLASAGSYRLSATNAAGTAQSNPAVLSLNEAVVVPQFTVQPASIAAMVGGTVSFSAMVSGSGPLTYQWLKDGAPLTGATSPTLTLPIVTEASVGSYRLVATNPAGSVQSSAATLTLSTVQATPTVSVVPMSQTVQPNAMVTLTAVVAGTGPLTYQWTRNGFAIPGATASVLVMNGVDETAGGAYRVIVHNDLGSVHSHLAHVIVTPAVGPTILVQPLGQSVVQGASVTLSVEATGPGPLTYQWHRSGVSLPGANAAQLVLTGVQLSDAGDYTVTVSNSSGSVVSAGATLAVTQGVASAITNVSVVTNLAAEQLLVVGFSVSGGDKSFLLRAVGPGLDAFGVPQTMPDPEIVLYQGGTRLEWNDNWGGDRSMVELSASVGAFGLAANSLDAALVSSVGGGRTAQIHGRIGGRVLVEVYDAGRGMTQRLTNISARNRVGSGGDVLIAGFTISGRAAKTVLIRAIGPSLGQFGVPAVLDDPKLEVYSGSTRLAENDSWSPSLAPVFARVGAFGLAEGSRDAATVLSLPPGGYTVQVSGVAGAVGEALIEVFEVQP
jgi:hypothetical protein